MVKIQLTTQGCSANLRESELMAGLLERSGHHVEHTNGHIDASDVHIVNICTVKKDNTPLHEIKRIKKLNPNAKIIAAGCITDSIVPKIKQLDSSISLVNTHNFGKISAVVEQSLLGSTVELLDKKYELKVDVPSLRKNPVIGIVPILNGCNYFCTFCSTKLVKGKLFSYPMDSIRNDVKAHLQAGCKEIWITSNDTGAYMVEQGGKQKIVELLEMILSIPMDFKVRVGMMNPGNTLTVLDKLLKVYKHPKMFKFLHIPLQAGNNDVLKGMNRQYTVEDFMKIVEAFRKELPDITLSTDIIVGFPGETGEQFQDTLHIVKNVEFDVVNISRYSAREGTKAATLRQIPSWRVKERSRALTKLQETISAKRNKKWLGWEGSVLIDEKGKDGTWIGRNHAYKPVVVNGDFNLGDVVNVTIEETTGYDLRGFVVF
jgi:MiaB-like tRNA modifying enzyme